MEKDHAKLIAPGNPAFADWHSLRRCKRKRSFAQNGWISERAPSTANSRRNEWLFHRGRRRSIFHHDSFGWSGRTSWRQLKNRVSAVTELRGRRRSENPLYCHPRDRKESWLLSRRNVRIQHFGYRIRRPSRYGAALCTKTESLDSAATGCRGERRCCGRMVRRGKWLAREDRDRRRGDAERNHDRNSCP